MKRLTILFLLAMTSGPIFGDEVGRPIDSLRAEIDRIDSRLVELIACRFRVVDSISDLKAEDAAPVRDPAREATLLARLAELGGEMGIAETGVREIFEAVLSASRARQMRRREIPAGAGIDGARSMLSCLPAIQKSGTEI